MLHVGAIVLPGLSGKQKGRSTRVHGVRGSFRQTWAEGLQLILSLYLFCMLWLHGSSTHQHELVDLETRGAALRCAVSRFSAASRPTLMQWWTCRTPREGRQGRCPDAPVGSSPRKSNSKSSGPWLLCCTELSAINSHGRVCV